MTTKSEMVFIQRVTERSLIVDDILVHNREGLWLTMNGVNLGDHRIIAIFKFLKDEKDNKDRAVTIAVRSLLNELNIPYQIS